MPEFFPTYRTPEDKRAEQILFVNARIYDGRGETLSEPKQVLVVKNLIKAVGDKLEMDSSLKSATVDCEGKTLMPGLIDMHSHLALQEGMVEGKVYDQMAMGAMTGHVLMDYLQQGFTTCRDAGGNVLGVAMAVNNNRIPGPRIFGCGAFLSQTGGHGDVGCGCMHQPAQSDYLQDHGYSAIVDGREEILKAARNNFRNGATQLKIMAGGGVASQFDPIHITQFTPDEMKAAVDIANDYGSYVMAHAYHDSSINRCLDAGVRCIEHGFLMSEETMKRIADEGCAMSIQAVMSLEAFGNPEDITFFSADQKMKAKQVFQGAEKMMKYVRKYKPIVISGGDMLGSAYVHRQADNIIAMVTLGGFSASLALQSATSNAGKVCAWSTGMNPYKDGPIGIIEEGAYADLIVVDGNPLEDITRLRRENVKVVLKDGICYKYMLPDSALTAE